MKTISNKLPFIELRIKREGPKVLAGTLAIALIIIGTLALLNATACPDLSIGKVSLIPLGGSIPMIAIGLGGIGYLIYLLIPKKKTMSNAEFGKIKKDFLKWQAEPPEYNAGIDQLRASVSNFDKSYHSFVDGIGHTTLVYKEPGSDQATVASFTPDGVAHSGPYGGSLSEQIARLNREGYTPLTERLGV